MEVCEVGERVNGCEFDVLENNFKIIIDAFLSSMWCIKFRTGSKYKIFNGSTLAFTNKGIT